MSKRNDAADSGIALLLNLRDLLDSDTGGKTGRDLAIEGLLKIRTKQGKVGPIRLNAAQEQMSQCWGRKNIVLKARQLGITTYVAARLFVDTICRPGTLTVQVAHDQEAAEEIFRIVHRFLENLPEALQGALTTSRANVRQLRFPRLDSEYRVETAADPNAGRGLTIQNLHCSEVARWPGDAAETLASLRAAVPPDGTVVLESTPNGAAGAFYHEWTQADVNGYVRHFFPWWIEKNYSREGTQLGGLTAEELELVKEHGLTLAQVAFRREVRANFRGLAVQEFAEDPISCFRASGECVFDVDVIDARRRAVLQPIESRYGGRLAIWWPPRSGGQYVVGVDPAGGGAGGDFACAQVIERSTGMQCAELHAHYTPRELAVRVDALAREYNNALVAVERNNHGHAVLAHLTATENSLPLYEHSGQLGWLTTAASRPRIIERFAAFLATHCDFVNSAGLLEECRTFVRRADGSAAAAAGTHDDRVMAMAIALEVSRAI